MNIVINQFLINTDTYHWGSSFCSQKTFFLNLHTFKNLKYMYHGVGPIHFLKQERNRSENKDFNSQIKVTRNTTPPPIYIGT